MQADFKIKVVDGIDYRIYQDGRVKNKKFLKHQFNGKRWYVVLGHTVEHKKFYIEDLIANF